MSMKSIKAFLINFKSTLSGIGAIAGGIALVCNVLADGWQDGDGNTLLAAGTAIAGGWGLIFARDADKSSQDSGVRPNGE